MRSTQEKRRHSRLLKKASKLDMADLMEIASFKRPAGAADIQAVLRAGSTVKRAKKDGSEAGPDRLDTESTCSGGASSGGAASSGQSSRSGTSDLDMENPTATTGNIAIPVSGGSAAAGLAATEEPSGREDSGMEEDADERQD